MKPLKQLVIYNKTAFNVIIGNLLTEFLQNILFGTDQYLVAEA